MPAATYPGWFYYAEKGGQDTINLFMLELFPDLWRKLHKLQNNLSFSKTTMTAASLAVLDKRQEEWLLTEERKLEQSKVLANMLRLACRHVCQALDKKTQPEWINVIFGKKVPDEEKKTAKKAKKVQEENEKEEEKSEEEQEEEEEVEEEVEEEEENAEKESEKPGKKKPVKTVTGTSQAAKAKPGKAKPGKAKPGKAKPEKAKPGKTVTGTSEAVKELGNGQLLGWDQELGSAWRSREGPLGAWIPREYSRDIKHPKDPQPHKFMLAMFGKDAYELKHMLTVEDWALRQNAMVDKPRQSGPLGTCWETEHKSSGVRVLIRRRGDRQPAIGLLHGTSQICQVQEHAFHDVPAAVAFLKVIGEKFAADLLPTKEQVYKLRAEMGKAQGIFFRENRRPAGTGSSEAASGSATAAVTGLSEAASGSATAAVTGSSETASGSSKRKQIVSASSKRKAVITNRPVVDKKVVKRKPGAAKVCNTPALARLEGKHEGDVVDVDDDEDVEFDFAKFRRKMSPAERFSCPGVFPPDFCR